MAAPAPSPPTPGRGGFLKRLTPQQKRMAIAVAAGGMLALFVLLRRGAPAAAATDTTAVSPTDPSAIGGLPADGSTFADNGASAGQLSTTLTDLSGQLQSLEDLFNQPVAAPLDSGLVASPVDTPAVDAAPAQLAATGGIRTAAAALKSKTVVKASAAHGGQQSVYRFTDTDPSKPGFEQKTYLRPATTAKPAAPAARPQATPKLPAGVFLQDSGTRAGLRYIVQSGSRRYESKAGAGNWGKGGVIKI